MASITAKISRRNVRNGGLGQARVDIRLGAIEGLKAIGIGMLSHAKRLLQKGPKSGITYRKYNPRRMHQASREGEAPATDTGFLVSSGFTEDRPLDLEVDIGFDAAYAKHLEYGTRNMAKRPFMKPTVSAWRKRIPKIMGAKIRERLK